MIPELGNFMLSLALALSILLSIEPLRGALCNNARSMSTGRPLSYGLFAATFLSFLCLAYSLAVNDFSVAYVASNSNSQLPIYFRIAAAWGAHEGSLLLWVLLLSSWTLAVALFSRQMPQDAEGRFESKNQAQNSGAKGNKSTPKSGMNNRCRNDQGRFESCE